MPFGGVNSTAEFQMRVDDALLRAGLAGVARSFVDDILVASQTASEHLQHVRAVLQALLAVGLKIHPGKSLFLADRVPFLGHLVTPDGREPEDAKVAAMLALPTPQNPAQLAAALGLLNFYRCYVPGYSTLAAPLTRLLRKDVPFRVDATAAAAFEQLKQAVARPGNALRHPDPARTFIIHADWSQAGIGGGGCWGSGTTMGMSTWWHAAAAAATAPRRATRPGAGRRSRPPGCSPSSGRSFGEPTGACSWSTINPSCSCSSRPAQATLTCGAGPRSCSVTRLTSCTAPAPSTSSRTR
jgi:hypothetical protein